MSNLPSIIAAIKKHAEDATPYECCGLIDVDGNVIRCGNMAKNREREFLISSSEVVHVSRRCRGLAGVYHSHVNQGAYISAADARSVPFTGLYIVASVMNGVCKTVNCFHWNGQYFSIVLP